MVILHEIKKIKVEMKKNTYLHFYRGVNNEKRARVCVSTVRKMKWQ